LLRCDPIGAGCRPTHVLEALTDATTHGQVRRYNNPRTGQAWPPTDRSGLAAEQRELVKGATEATSRTTGSRPVLLMVVEIRSYGRVLSDVEAGLTAQLLADPMTTDLVVHEGDVLVGSDERTPS
jgi:hypothetical protein